MKTHQIHLKKWIYIFIGAALLSLFSCTKEDIASNDYPELEMNDVLSPDQNVKPTRQNQ